MPKSGSTYQGIGLVKLHRGAIPAQLADEIAGLGFVRGIVTRIPGDYTHIGAAEGHRWLRQGTRQGSPK